MTNRVGHAPQAVNRLRFGPSFPKTAALCQALCSCPAGTVLCCSKSSPSTLTLQLCGACSSQLSLHHHVFFKHVLGQPYVACNARRVQQRGDRAPDDPGVGAEMDGTNNLARALALEVQAAKVNAAIKELLKCDPSSDQLPLLRAKEEQLLRIAGKRRKLEELNIAAGASGGTPAGATPPADPGTTGSPASSALTSATIRSRKGGAGIPLGT